MMGGGYHAETCDAQTIDLFIPPKSVSRTWTEHYLYLFAVRGAGGGADNLVQDNIVQYVDPAMRVSMLARLNLMRTDYLRQADSWHTSRSQRKFNFLGEWDETSSVT